MNMKANTVFRLSLGRRADGLSDNPHPHIGIIYIMLSHNPQVPGQDVDNNQIEGLRISGTALHPEWIEH